MKIDSRKIIKSFLFFCLFFNFSYHSLTQSLIINEVSQGPTGSKEYVEFLVVPGSGPYQCSNYCIDLRGWIIDDNNGYFSGGGGSGLGIANGAVRFSNDIFWQCIPIGTLILVYNDQDLNVAVPGIDNSTSDGNCRLILPISSTLFENQIVSPTTASATYPSTGWSPGGLWGPISMANGGDSFQIYNASNLTTPVHGISWVNNNINNIIYFSTSATNSVYFFANTVDNNPSNQANWVAGTCSAPDNQTPGSPNNATNASYIQSLTNNCAGPLTATLSSSTDAGSCQCNGTATVSAIGSIPGYSYQWFDASNNSIGQITATATNLCPGTYSCIVTSSINCTDTVFVTINSSTTAITPTFTQISPTCSGGTFTLPTTSNNGITGTWSPAINNSTTTTYTFTPNSGQCASSTTMTVTVNSQTSPTFTQVAPICSGGSFTLPTTSNNGITGAWSPAINNLATTTYTFTPNSGQCATSTTMTVTVNSQTTPSFTQVAPICSGISFTLPTTSNNGITGAWSPAINNSATTTYTFTPNSGQCASSTTMTVTVNSQTTPTFTPVAPICSGGSFTLPTTSNNGITGAWSPAINNSATTTYTFTPNSGQCASSTTMTVVVSNGFSPTFNPISAICEGGSFLLPTSSNEGVTGSWSPAINNLQTTSYTFTPDPGQCANSTNLIVEVNQIPQISINENPTICQGESTTLTTTVNINGGTYLWSPGGQTTDSITLSPSINGAYSVTYEVNGCQSQAATSTVTVNPSTVPTFNTFGPFCQDAVLAQVLLPETSNNGISGTWNLAMLSTATPGINSYLFTPDPGQCAEVFTLNVEVFSAPIIDAGNNLTICVGSSVQLNASGGIQYSWTSGIQNGQPFQPTQSQVYYVTGTDINGCEATDSVIVVLVPFPIAQFSSDLNSGTAPLTVNFTNTSSNATSFDWNFGDGNQINSADLSNVTNLFLNPGSYTVWLVASNGLCSDSISNLIIVDAPGEPILTVPNVLTPNGDGTNDEWFIYTENIAELEVIIVNRWGNEITKIDGVTGTWDGKTSNGVDVTDGTYFYKYQAKGLNGDELSGHGFITLIR